MTAKTNNSIAIIAGVQKCGTTTLYASLNKHSNINSPIDPVEKKLIKELDFFYEEEKWKRGLDWYFSHFKGKKGIMLDASPNYLKLRICYERIYKTFPEAKLIICLRNPVDRAYSQYNHYCQDMPQTQHWDWVFSKSFLSNLKLELKSGIVSKDDFRGFLHKGAYIKQIKLLLNFFKRSQLYITVMDQWSYNYDQELENIQSFLKLKKEVLPAKITHWRDYTVEPLSDKAKKILTDYYKPFNEELFDFLGYEIQEWTM
jgi:hypothetical protein